ncbi:MAG: DMT family transporter [Ardenticatenaceae bacterium]|nr:DMT family transporter [Anaerolineales bacterium]MCB8921236.1 DMT family transporter [Ardenticatenaceae bacterium]MCB8990602.1 DMT family transporter [Ardenticatenaceae bacterium]MCB9004309.1 DMT family transporter [Ardenticatenaceae bacterium]
MFLGELAALGTAVCWSLTAISFSYSGRLIGSDVVNRSRLIFALLFLSITHFFIEGTFFPTHVEAFRWGWLGLSGLLGLALGDTFLFQAYVLLGPRLAMLMMATVPIYSTLFGWLLFGETVSTVEVAGIALAIGGIGWVVTEKRPGMTVVENKQYSKGLLMGLLGALGQVANLVTARYGMVGGFSSLSATMIRILVGMTVLWLVAALRGQVGHSLRQWRNKKAFAALIGGAVSGPFLGIWLSLTAISLARLGIASTLMALPPVILIPLEFVLFKRRVSGRAVVGTAVAMLGVALLFNIV